MITCYRSKGSTDLEHPAPHHLKSQDVDLRTWQTFAELYNPEEEVKFDTRAACQASYKPTEPREGEPSLPNKAEQGPIAPSSPQ